MHVPLALSDSQVQSIATVAVAFVTGGVGYLAARAGALVNLRASREQHVEDERQHRQSYYHQFLLVFNKLHTAVSQSGQPNPPTVDVDQIYQEIDDLLATFALLSPQSVYDAAASVMNVVKSIGDDYSQQKTTNPGVRFVDVYGANLPRVKDALDTLRVAMKADIALVSTAGPTTPPTLPPSAGTSDAYRAAVFFGTGLLLTGAFYTKDWRDALTAAGLALITCSALIGGPELFDWIVGPTESRLWRKGIKTAKTGVRVLYSILLIAAVGLASASALGGPATLFSIGSLLGAGALVIVLLAYFGKQLLASSATIPVGRGRDAAVLAGTTFVAGTALQFFALLTTHSLV